MLVQLFKTMPFIVEFWLKLKILLSYKGFVNDKAGRSIQSFQEQ